MYNTSVEGSKEFLFANREPLLMVTPDSLDKNRRNMGNGSLREMCMNKISGVYEIVNTVNGKRYIGSSIGLVCRLREHLNLLRRCKHHNKHLQSAFNKYGENVFIFHPLLYCDPDNTLLYEQMCMDGLRPGYNKSGNAEAPTRGIRFSEERIAKMRGRKPSNATLEKLRMSHLGHKASEETRAKMGMARKGKKLSDEIRANMSAAQKGRTFSEEALVRMSAAHKGRPSGNKGHKYSDESRAKISAALIGRVASDETRAKMREGHKGERAYNSKLTLEKAEEIRNRYIPRKVSQRKLAAEYGVDQQVIWAIVNYKTWRID